jgi:hypothetical protein
MTTHNNNQARVQELLDQGLKPKMIAKRLGISVSTVYVHMHRASRKEKEE